ncbi:hypothetical protein Tco_1230962, partial [Tanacetum coccineum]
FERCDEEVLEARVHFAHFVHFGERLLCYGKNLRVVDWWEERLKVYGSWLRECLVNVLIRWWRWWIRASWSARVVLRVVRMELFSRIGEDSFEEMSMTLVLANFLGGFLVVDEALEFI